MTFRGQKELKSLTLFFTKLWGPYSYDKLKLNYFSSKVTHYVLQNFNSDDCSFCANVKDDFALLKSEKPLKKRKIDTVFKLTTSSLITIVSTVILPIAPVPIVDAPPISAAELPEVAWPRGWRGNIPWAGCSGWKMF